jgi:uncharacterized protein YraI
MSQRYKILSGLSLLFLAALLGCSPPSQPSKLTLEQQAGTIVAQTLQAQSTPSAESAAVSSATAIGTATPAATASPTATITPTYSTPTLTLNANTNCRSGPGQDFSIVTTLQDGATAEIVGRYADNSYWVIKLPDGTSTCWIWGEYATASGSYHILPEVTPPPAPSPSAPTAPGNLTYSFFCTANGSGNNVDTQLSWDDRSGNESGYRIYRNDSQIVELPANSNAFSDSVAVGLGESLTYSVEAFNDAGASGRASISFTCP